MSQLFLVCIYVQAAFSSSEPEVCRDPWDKNREHISVILRLPKCLTLPLTFKSKQVPKFHTPCFQLNQGQGHHWVTGLVSCVGSQGILY